MTAKQITPTSFEDAITKTGFGLYNLILLVVCGACLMCVIIETMSMMFIIPAAQCDLVLDLTTKGLLSAISFLGVMLSSYVWGFLADTKGRRYVLILSMFLSFITSFISALMPNAWIFIFVRFINGLAVGGASSCVYAYIGEFHSNSFRPRMISWIASFVAFGNMVIPAFAWLLLPLDMSFNLPLLNIEMRSWRLLIMLYSILSLVSTIGMYCLPESPKFLLTQYKHDEALAVLERIYRLNSSAKKKDDFGVNCIVLNEDNSDNDVEQAGSVMKAMWKQTTSLVKKPHGVKTFMVCLLQFGAFCSSSGLLMWYPDLLNKLTAYSAQNPGEPIYLCDAVNQQINTPRSMFASTYFYDQFSPRTLNESMPTVCDDTVSTDVFITSIFIGLIFAIIYLIMGVVINIFGAKKLLIVFLVGTSLCGITVNFISGLFVIELLLIAFLTVATCVGVVNTIVVDLYPTKLRGMAMAISLMFGRFGAMAGSNITGPLLYNYCDYLFYVYTLGHVIMIITIMLLPSPKRAKQ